MIGLLLALTLAFPQVPGPEAQVLLLTGAVHGNRLDLTELGLGDGGLSGSRVSPRAHQGWTTSPGGILVRAQPQGVKLDFPSGAELLVSPSGRVHLRGGEATQPAGRGGLELILADGARLRVVSRVSSGKLESVQFLTRSRQITLWGRPPRIVEAGHGGGFKGRILLVLGDGQVLYDAVWLGPVLVLERKLCPRTWREHYPDRRVVIIGDILRESLSRLADTIPRKTVEFPQAPEAARTLAGLAPVLFPDGSRVHTPISPGAMLLKLAGGFRLRVTVTEKTTQLGLQHTGSEVPIAEWTVTGHTRLQLVRPGGGGAGKPRYYLKGLKVSRRGRELLGSHQSFLAEERARSVLVKMGAAPLGRLLNLYK